MDEVQGRRTKRKGRPDVLTALEKVAANLEEELSLPLKVTRESLSDYIAALIMPKSIQMMRLNDFFDPSDDSKDS
jgi:hypothetical protein